MFRSILENTTATMDLKTAMMCTASCVLCGVIIAICYYLANKEEANKNFCLSLVILPVLVQTIIMMVNGNLGTGVAIVGAFSLIRFRSIPGTSREISAVFFTMVVGLAAGMGYISYAIFITIFINAVIVIAWLLPLKTKSEKRQLLKVTIYEDLDYTTIFDEVFEEYLCYYKMDMVKTTNMGSMYLCQYIIEQKDNKKEKEFIDALRCRNGNLNIVCCRVPEVLERL